MNILILDVGGTSVKMKLDHLDEVRKVPSGPNFTPTQLVEGVRKQAADWTYGGVTVGFPGPIIDGRIVQEPATLGTGWVGFDFSRALGKPVKLINDAAMQALGSYEGGRMLFLGLGTGLGSTFIADGV